MTKKEELIQELAEAESLLSIENERTVGWDAWKRLKDYNYSRAWRKTQRIERAIEKLDLLDKRKELGMPNLIDKLRNRYGMTVSRKQTTAVRGWYDYTHGYKISNVGHIEFIGGCRQFKEIVADFEKTHNIKVTPMETSLLRTRGSIEILSKKNNG